MNVKKLIKAICLWLFRFFSYSIASRPGSHPVANPSRRRGSQRQIAFLIPHKKPVARSLRHLTITERLDLSLQLKSFQPELYAWGW